MSYRYFLSVSIRSQKQYPLQVFETGNLTQEIIIIIINMLEAKIKSIKGTCEVTQRLITAGNSPPTRAGRVKGKIGPGITDPWAAGAGMFTTNWQEAGSQHPG